MKAFIKNSFSTGDAGFKASIGLLLMRLFLGGVMLINHGLPKLDKDVSSLPNPLNLHPSLSGGLILFAEIFCAGLIIVGFASRWACLVLAISMGTAFFIFHEASLTDGELALAYFSGYLSILIIGPGSLSADKFIHKK